MRTIKVEKYWKKRCDARAMVGRVVRISDCDVGVGWMLSLAVQKREEEDDVS